MRFLTFSRGFRVESCYVFSVTPRSLLRFIGVAGVSVSNASIQFELFSDSFIIAQQFVIVVVLHELWVYMFIET